MLTSFTLTRLDNGQTMSSIKGSNVNVTNVGKVSGSASFMLSETNDSSPETVFDVMQLDSSGFMSIDVAGNDNNTRFTGSNINARFNAENNYGYNVELNTVNSSFDFSGTNSGAQISTTSGSAYNRVQLGGGKNVVHYETIDAALTSTGQAQTRFFNNLVTDSGYSNVFLSSKNSQTKFETTKDSRGAFIQGGYGNDVFDIGGTYGVFNGVAGDNIFTTAEAKSISDTSAFNVVFGGVGANTYNDFGIKNMYQGAYALYGAGTNGADLVRLNGVYGIARIDTSGDLAARSDIMISGSYNAGFTGERGEVDGVTLNYNDVLLGRVGNFTSTTAWTLDNFYSSNYAPTGYAGSYSYSLLQNVLK